MSYKTAYLLPTLQGRGQLWFLDLLARLPVPEVAQDLCLIVAYGVDDVFSRCRFKSTHGPAQEGGETPSDEGKRSSRKGGVATALPA
jgi:hypothetical protein